MRTFRDSNGTAWTVFEVRRQISSSGDKTSYLPGGFNDGWLCFETAGAKRRLTKYPSRWREFGDDELVKLLDQAQAAPKGSMRIYDDLGESPNTDARPE
jgi:hypothetical protein